MDTEIELFKSPKLWLLGFCFWCWMKSEVYKSKGHKRDELLARILDADTRIKKCHDQVRRTTRDIRTAVAVDGVISEHYREL
jgi:hypothetical protein